MKNFQFYDELSIDYDSMINFSKSLENRKKLFKNIITPDIKIAADIGCGTGLDSIALSELGLNVNAFDPSSEMLKIAKNNAAKYNSKISFHNFGAELLPEIYFEKFDIAFSLGNAIANIPPDILSKSFERIFKTLKNGKKLYVQILNYERIRKTNNRIVNITKNNDKIFVRFYDFNERNLIFNILTIEEKNPSEHTLISTQLFEYERDFLYKALKDSGFKKVNFYGDLNLNEFSTDNSKDIILIAEK